MYIVLESSDAAMLNVAVQIHTNFNEHAYLAKGSGRGLVVSVLDSGL